MPPDTAPSARARTNADLTPREREVAAVLVGLLSDHLAAPAESIALSSSLIDDLGADSLGLVELVLAIEEAFELDIPDEDTERFVTVDDVVAYIARVKP
jgi:acyl carrier protein